MKRHDVAARGGLVAFVALVVLGAALASPWRFDLGVPAVDWLALDISPPPQAEATATPTPVEEPPAQPRGNLLLYLLVGAGVLVLGLLLAVVVRRLLEAWRPDDARTPPDELGTGDTGAAWSEEAPVDLPALQDAVARAHAHLAGVTDPDDAVVAAWVALEDEAARQGTGREPAQTATEFTAALLARTAAPEDAVATLRRLYHRARFTTHRTAPADVAGAREALTRIAGALESQGSDRAAGGTP